MICKLFFLLSRRAHGGDRDFLLIGTVLDATCFALPVFQLAARRKAHCLFVVAFHSWSCSCFRRVAASVQSFDMCVLREVGHCQCRDFFMVVGQLGSRFTWVLKGVFLKALCSFQHITF